MSEPRITYDPTDGLLDELVADNATVHLERLDHATSKRFLADLVRVARGEKDLRMAKQAAQTEARTAGIWNARRNRRSDHAVLRPDLPPLRGSSTGAAAPSAPAAAPDEPCPHEDPRGARYCALCRHGIAA